MGIIGWIVFGLIVGAVAKLLMPGRDPGGWIVTILLGIAGALVGGFLGRAAGWYGPNDAAGFLMSILGAIVLLFLYRLARGQHADQAVGRRPLRRARVHQELLLRRPRAEARGELLEAAVVEVRGDFDHPGHGVTSSPRRWRESPAAPRNAALRAAMALA